MNELLKPPVPEYTIKIPSTGKEVKVRPFLVGEERLLLMALEGKDEQSILDTTKQIVSRCIIDDDVKIDVDKLPFYDVDYLFIALRAKSIGENVDINWICRADVDGEECGTTFPAKIDISNVIIEKNEEIKDIVDLPNQMKIKLKVPSYTAVKSILDDSNTLDQKIRLIVASIEYIQNRDQIITLKDVTENDYRLFVEGLTQEHFRKLEMWVDNFPSFLVQQEAACPKCGFNHSLRFDDLDRFFII
jgi:hypothetical protein